MNWSRVVAWGRKSPSTKSLPRFPTQRVRSKSTVTSQHIYETDTPYTYTINKPFNLSSNPLFSPDNVYAQAIEPKIEHKVKTHHHSDDVLYVEWANGTKSEMTFTWLRDHCHCRECLHPSTFQRQVDTLNIPSKLEPLKIKIDENEMRIQWKEDGKGRHETVHPLSFFEVKSFGLSDPLSWTKSSIKKLPLVKFAEMTSGPVGMAKTMDLLKIYGFVLVEGIEKSVEGTQVLAEKLGPVRTTLYGGMWDVSPNLAMSDTAYTTDGLNPHTDGCYFVDPPGLQILHIMEFNGKGGQTTLVDGLSVAKQLRESHPDTFKYFCTTPIPFHYLDESNHLMQKRTIFELNEQGELLRFSFNNDDRAPFTLPAKEMKSFYAHLKRLLERIRDPENLLEFQMPPGTAALIDNWRVMHGRKGFSGHRRLGGCYISREDIVSRHVVANKKVRDMQE